MLPELLEVTQRFLLKEVQQSTDFKKGCEQGLSKELLDEAKWPRGDLCGHCWNTSKEEKPKAPKAQSGSCLGTMQGWFYSRMEANPDVTAEPLGEPGMHLRWG